MKWLLFLFATSAFAGPLTELTVIHDYFIASDGINHPATYTNNTGNTLFIKRLRVYLFPGGASGGLSGSVVRGSDQSGLTYWAWSINADDTLGNGPHGNVVVEDYSPDYFQLNAGDTLTMNAFSSSFSGNSNLSCWIWYSLTPD